MEENKTKQYTFGPNEKEILQNMATVETSVGQHIEQKYQSELVYVKYYSEFVVDTPKGPVTLNNVYITAERSKTGDLSYHFRWMKQNENGETFIEEQMVVTEDGEVYVAEGLREYLGDAQIDIDSLMLENDDIEKGRLKGISEKADSNEMKKILQDQKAGKEEQENEETQKVEQDLNEQGEDLEITSYKKIKDTKVAERMPEVFGEGTEHGLAYSKKLNTYAIVSKVNDKYQLNENVEQAQTTMKTIISVDANGQGVERKVPHALMRTNRDDKEIAVTIGQYGEPDIETVDVLPCQERIAREVRTQGEGIEKQESLEISNEFRQQGKNYKHDLAHRVQEVEKAQKEANETVDYDITPDDYIPNTEITWGKLMKETGESLPKLIERYDRELAKEGADSQKAVEIIEQDYGLVNRQQQY